MKLFEKTGRRMELTQVGKDILPNVWLMINSIPSEEINQAVMDGSADIGINCEKESYPDTIIHKNLGTYRALLDV